MTHTHRDDLHANIQIKPCFELLFAFLFCALIRCFLLSPLLHSARNALQKHDAKRKNEQKKNKKQKKRKIEIVNVFGWCVVYFDIFVLYFSLKFYFIVKQILLSYKLRETVFFFFLFLLLILFSVLFIYLQRECISVHVGQAGVQIGKWNERLFLVSINQNRNSSELIRIFFSQMNACVHLDKKIIHTFELILISK